VTNTGADAVVEVTPRRPAKQASGSSSQAAVHRVGADCDRGPVLKQRQSPTPNGGRCQARRQKPAA